MDVSIIIVNYNTKELTRDCLKSVFERTEGISFEVIVSDNGSTDGSAEMIRAEFPAVVLIENGANLGFGAANNRALDVARGKYVLYLNSDTVLLNNAVKMFFDYWQCNQDKVCALGCILQDGNGTVIHSGDNFPTYKYLCRYYSKRMLKNWLKSLAVFLRVAQFLKNISRKKTIGDFRICAGEIDYITGADLFLKNDAHAYFDESFFLYYEETDLQMRLKRAVKKSCILLEEPKIVHFTYKQNSACIVETKSQIFNQISAIKYAKKYFKDNPLLLKIVFKINMANPYIRKVFKSIDKALIEID